MAIVDLRQKVLMEGPLRHRQHPSIGMIRWKRRHVIFRMSSAGRLEFLIYKESTELHPTLEVKSIPIEEFGGLETNIKLDTQEKFTFAVITTNATDCFATDSLADYTEWTSIIREYLGKELVLNITVPSRQHMLRSGKAQLRIRNTGFNITTCENPPRCQGTWQIIHIRQFGGEDMFKFQTGSKCPTGKFLYKIQADDIGRIKSLFNDLSQHKPIFPDDRVGRQMLECNQHARKGSRIDYGGNAAEQTGYSPHLHNPVYSNVPTLPILPSSREPVTIDGSIHSSEGSYLQESPSTGGDYQNVPPSTKGRWSPHVQGFIPYEHGTTSSDGRTNLSPPAALKKLRPLPLGGTHTFVSTEEQGREDLQMDHSAPVHEDDHTHDSLHANPGDRHQVYQNLSISVKEDEVDKELSHARTEEATGQAVTPGEAVQNPPCHVLAADHSGRSYANVEVAKLSVRGIHNKGRKTSVEILPGSIQLWNREAASTPTSPHKHQRSSNGEGAVHLSDGSHHHHVLELSHSMEELESEQTDGSCCSPDLILPPPPRILGQTKTLGSPDGSGSSSSEDQFVLQEQLGAKKMSSDVYSSADHLDRQLDMVDADQFNSDSEVEVKKRIKPRYDSLEILSPLVKNTQVDRATKVSPPQSGIYDSLAPLEVTSRRSSSPTVSTGPIAPQKVNGTVSPVRPQLEHLDAYHRKMMVTGRVHTYEMISLGSDDIDDAQPPPPHFAQRESPDHTHRTQRNVPNCEATNAGNDSVALNKQHTSAALHHTAGKPLKQSPSSVGMESKSGMGQQKPPRRSESDRQLFISDDGNNPIGKRARGIHENVVIKGRSPPDETTSQGPAPTPRLSEGCAKDYQLGSTSDNTPTQLPKPRSNPNWVDDDDPQADEEEEEVMGTYIHTTSNGSVRPSLSLPSANIVFNVPPVPPKPKILTHQQTRDRYYAQLDLPVQRQKQSKPLLAEATPASPVIVNNHHHNVDYTEIDLPSTAQLATMRKERQEEKGLAERQKTIKLRAT